MPKTVLEKVKRNGRFVVAFVALTVAFVLSVQFSDRGVQFDLRQSSVSAKESADGTYDLSALKVLNQVLLQLKENYVEPERIHPSKMLVAALDEVEASIPEVLVEVDGPDDAPKKIRVAVAGESKGFEVDRIESLWEMSFRLKEIFHFVEDHLEPSPDRDFRDIEYAAVNGMLSTLDPHSTLLPPKHYEEMQTQTGGKFGGLGIVISIRDGALTVISPIDDTPASRKGIKAGDKIVRIEDESTINMNLSEAVNMLRGEPGSEIKLWISRKPWPEPKPFVIERAIINIESVDSKALDDKVGYIRIKNFQANTYSDLVKHLDKLKKKMGGMQGLVLDMRDNPGGLLDQAIKVSDKFIDQGTIVSTVGAGNKLRDTKVATKSGTEPNYPIVVLVNAGSASASEIVSGALQNHNRALVVGDTTFGKGSVQVLSPFADNSALKLTVAQYLTPGDVSIQGKGIAPDLRLVPVSIVDGEVDMFLSNNILREGDLASALSNEAAKRANQDGFGFVRFYDEEAAKQAEGEQDEFEDPNAFKEDFAIRFGQNLVAAAGQTYKRPELLDVLKPEIEKLNESEMKTLQKQLAKLGVDWADGETPKSADVELAVEPQKAAEGWKAGESYELTAKLTNKGSQPLYRVKAVTMSDNPVLDDQEFIFGKIEPGKTRSWTVTVDVPKDMPTRHEMVAFQVSAPHNVEYGEKVEVPVRIVGLDRPQFAFNYEIDDASGDGVLQNGEEVKLRAFVENVGQADSEETLIYLRNLAGEAVYLEKGRVTLDSIKKGETTAVEFAFKVKALPEEDNVKLELDAFDTTFREFTSRELTVPFSSSKSDAQKLSGKATVTNGPAKLFVASSAKSDVVGIAKKGATLPVVGRIADWVRLDTGQGHVWVQANLVDVDKGASAKVTGLQRRVRFQAPSVKLDPAEAMTSKKTVRLEGSASDDSAVKDYYIFVFNRESATKANTRKIKYSRVGNDAAKIAANVPLYPGMNRISVVARDDEGMTTTQSTFVYRQ